MAENNQSAPAKPTVISFFLCEKIIRDKKTGRTSIVNIVSWIASEIFPFCVSLEAFMILTEIHGSTRIKLSIVRDSDHKELQKSGEAEVKLDDPLRWAEADVQFPCICFEYPGQYALELFADGDLVSCNRFYVLGPGMTLGGG